MNIKKLGVFIATPLMLAALVACTNKKNSVHLKDEAGDTYEVKATSNSSEVLKVFKSLSTIDEIEIEAFRTSIDSNLKGTKTENEVTYNIEDSHVADQRLVFNGVQYSYIDPASELTTDVELALSRIKTLEGFFLADGEYYAKAGSLITRTKEDIEAIKTNSATNGFYIKVGDIQSKSNDATVTSNTIFSRCINILQTLRNGKYYISTSGMFKLLDSKVTTNSIIKANNYIYNTQKYADMLDSRSVAALDNPLQYIEDNSITIKGAKNDTITFNAKANLDLILSPFMKGFESDDKYPVSFKVSTKTGFVTSIDIDDENVSGRVDDVAYTFQKADIEIDLYYNEKVKIPAVSGSYLPLEMYLKFIF